MDVPHWFSMELFERETDRLESVNASQKRRMNVARRALGEIETEPAPDQNIFLARMQQAQLNATNALGSPYGSDPMPGYYSGLLGRLFG